MQCPRCHAENREGRRFCGECGLSFASGDGRRPRSTARRRGPIMTSRKEDAYQLEDVLRDLEPPIWRRLQVPGSLTLDRLHLVLQQAMGWTDSHLHEFVIAGRRYGVPDPERGPMVILPEQRVRLRDVAPAESGRFLYRYDFGDDWKHEVLVEQILAAGEGGGSPVCLRGERRCPPEDCGGGPGHVEVLAAIRDAGHPPHPELLEWVGGAVDTQAFVLT